MAPNSLSREFLHERDTRIYQLRSTGMTPEQIAKQFDITPRTVHSAIRRRISEIGKSQLSTYPEIILMELERYDKLQAAIWPYTQPRRVTLDDDTQITVDPDPKFVQQVLVIMKDRQKLLGLDIQRMDIQSSPDPADVRHGLHGDEEAFTTNYEDESKQMIALAAKAGIIDSDTANALLGNQVTIDADVVEAEVIDEPTRIQETEASEEEGPVQKSPKRHGLSADIEDQGKDAS